MNLHEQKLIDDLFTQLATIDHAEEKWDSQAHQRIQSYIEAYPWLVYYMTQILLVQEQALLKTQRYLPRSVVKKIFDASGLFPDPPQIKETIAELYSEAQPSLQEENGFLRSALRTTLDVVGGVALGNLFPPTKETAADPNLDPTP